MLNLKTKNLLKICYKKTMLNSIFLKVKKNPFYIHVQQASQTSLLKIKMRDLAF